MKVAFYEIKLISKANYYLNVRSKVYVLCGLANTGVRDQTLHEVVEGIEKVLNEDDMITVGVEVVLEEAEDGLDEGINQGAGAVELPVTNLSQAKGPW